MSVIAKWLRNNVIDESSMFPSRSASTPVTAAMIPGPSGPMTDTAYEGMGQVSVRFRGNQALDSRWRRTVDAAGHSIDLFPRVPRNPGLDQGARWHRSQRGPGSRRRDGATHSRTPPDAARRVYGC